MRLFFYESSFRMIAFSSHRGIGARFEPRVIKHPVAAIEIAHITPDNSNATPMATTPYPPKLHAAVLVAAEAFSLIPAGVAQTSRASPHWSPAAVVFFSIPMRKKGIALVTKSS
jgi:hypothetical protein